jgi:hypothetical protein
MQREFTPNPYRIEGECAIIGLLDRRGAVAAEVIIDLADLAVVLPRRWCLQRTRVLYAVTSDRGRSVYMHRFLIGAPPGRVVDHRNHDGLDNRRANIRECSVAENTFHRRAARPGSRSGVRNVYWHKATRSWYVEVAASGRRHFFGSFRDIHEAEQAAIKARASLSEVAA